MTSPIPLPPFLQNPNSAITPTTVTVRSEAQREAARRNGAQSRGPRTEPGKIRSSRNALKHGLSGAGRVLPEDLGADLERRRRNLVAAYRPRDEHERDLLKQAALGAARLHRLLLTELDRAEQRTRDAIKTWDEIRAAEVFELTRALRIDPIPTLSKLRATCEGCDELAEIWLTLGRAIEDRGTLDLDELERGLALLGTRPDARSIPSEAAQFRALVHQTRRDGPEADDARSRLLDQIDAAVAELVERGNHLWEHHDRPDREGAPRRAHFDPTPEGRLLVRYISDSESLQRRALAELHRYRRDQPRPAPARNEPEPPSPAITVPSPQAPDPASEPSQSPRIAVAETNPAPIGLTSSNSVPLPEPRNEPEPQPPRSPDSR